MKKHTQKLTLIIFLFCIALSSKAQMNVTWADTLNKLLIECRGDENMQGVAAGVTFSDGSTWSFASGYHNYGPLSKDFLYDIGSNTKSMVATIILQMEEEGKLSLDDTLYTYMAPIPNVSFGITLKQLLGHRSGVYSFTNHSNFGSFVNNNPYEFLHPDSVLAQFLDAPNFAPGTSWEYSNTGYILLGKVIEGIESKPFNQVLNDRIFTPLGLDSIYLDQYDSYTLTKTGTWFSQTSYDTTNFISFMSAAWAAGGVVSTPKDFAKYTHNLFGGQLFSAASLQKMQTGSSINGGRTYGLGAIKWNYKGRTYLGHGGTTLQNSEMEYSVASDFSLVIMNIDYNFFNETTRTKLKFLDLLEYIEDVHANSVGLDDNSIAGVKVSAFPNPSTDYITLEVELDNLHSNITVELRDVSGKKVFEQEFEQNEIVLHKNILGSGVYFARVFSGHQLVQTKKLVFN